MGIELTYAESIHAVSLDDAEMFSTACLRRFAAVGDNEDIHPSCKDFLVELARARGLVVNEDLSQRIRYAEKDDRIRKEGPDERTFLFAEIAPDIWAAYKDALARAEALWRYELAQPSDKAPEVMGKLAAELRASWDALEFARNEVES